MKKDRASDACIGESGGDSGSVFESQDLHSRALWLLNILQQLIGDTFTSYHAKSVNKVSPKKDPDMSLRLLGVTS